MSGLTYVALVSVMNRASLHIVSKLKAADIVLVDCSWVQAHVREQCHFGQAPDWAACGGYQAIWEVSHQRVSTRLEASRHNKASDYNAYHP